MLSLRSYCLLLLGKAQAAIVNIMMVRHCERVLKWPCEIYGSD